jgi:hypothetical protein
MEVLRVLKPTLYSNAMSLPALSVFAYLWQSPRFGAFARSNLWTQLVVFVATVQVPAFVTGRLSYVDLAWPTGLLAMGVVGLMRALRRIFFRSDETAPSSGSASGVETTARSSLTARRGGFTAGNIRAVVVSLAYCFQGGRMALGAWTMFFAGHLRKEMQRCQFPPHCSTVNPNPNPSGTPTNASGGPPTA